MVQVSPAVAGSTASAQVAASSAIVCRSPGEVANPFLRVVLERARHGTRPGARTDDHRRRVVDALRALRRSSTALEGSGA